MHKNITKLFLSFILLITLVFNFHRMVNSITNIPTTALPAAELFTKTAPMTSLENFVLSVTNGDSKAVVGVYVPGVLALPVGQQPQGNAGYVTRDQNMTTQFDLANKYGTVGILAHNYLAGDQFYRMQENQYAIVIYGDGRLDYYMVSDVQKYQALSPTSTYSDFINIDNPDELLTASQLFNRIYGENDRLVFQTCIAAQGNSSWGRIFIIAEPATNQVSSALQETSFMLRITSFGMATQY